MSEPLQFNHNKVIAAMTCMDGLTPEQAFAHLALAMANVVSQTTKTPKEAEPCWQEAVFTDVGPEKRTLKVRIDDVKSEF